MDQSINQLTLFKKFCFGIRLVNIFARNKTALITQQLHTNIEFQCLQKGAEKL